MTSFLIEPPLAPMLAKAVDGMDALPDVELLYEPKWDGFRALVFKHGAEVYTQSRDHKPLNRYFPELVEQLARQLPDRCVLDGEIVLARGGALDFDALQQRLHPAASRVARLASETPASFVAFDLLALDDDGDVTPASTAERRAMLTRALERVAPPIHVTPVTRDRALAEDWFRRFEGAGLDGVIAKPSALSYQPNKRVLFKIKHRRTADCVLAGFRWHKQGKDELVGSLLLGLFDDEDALQHVGVTSTFTMARRRELARELAPLREGALDHHPWAAWASAMSGEEMQRRPGMGSRWSAGKDLSWEPVRIERVVEVRYDQLQGGRFRHGTTFLRWREDKAPADCTYEQLETTPPYELEQIFGAR